VEDASAEEEPETKSPVSRGGRRGKKSALKVHLLADIEEESLVEGEEDG